MQLFNTKEHQRVLFIDKGVNIPFFSSAPRDCVKGEITELYPNFSVMYLEPFGDESKYFKEDDFDCVVVVVTTHEITKMKMNPM